MARPGPAPKDADKRLGHRTQAELVTTSITKPTAPAPALPGAGDFSEATRRWYQVWAHSAQASQFLETDWLLLHMLAPMVDRYYETEDPRIFSEIRINLAKLGATPEDRQRLRWIARPDEASPQGKTTQSARKRKDPRHLAAVQ
jgi:hypothetical protein